MNQQSQITYQLQQLVGLFTRIMLRASTAEPAELEMMNDTWLDGFMRLCAVEEAVGVLNIFDGDQQMLADCLGILAEIQLFKERAGVELCRQYLMGRMRRPHAAKFVRPEPECSPAGGG